MIKIEMASSECSEKLLVLQKLAYQSEAEIYNDWSLPALTQTQADLAAEFANTHFINALSDGKIVGSIRAKSNGHTCDIGRLIVHPEHQGKGIGSALLKAMEVHFDDVSRYELFTGNKSVTNIRLYERKGYKVTHEKSLSENVSITYMEKLA